MGLGFLTRDNVLHLVIPTDKRSYHKYFQDSNIHRLLHKPEVLAFVSTMRPETLDKLYSRKHIYYVDRLYVVLSNWFRQLKHKSNILTVNELYDLFDIFIDAFLRVEDKNMFISSAPKEVKHIERYCLFMRYIKCAIWSLPSTDHRRAVISAAVTTNEHLIENIVDLFINQRVFGYRDRRFLITYFESFPEGQVAKYFKKYHYAYSYKVE